MAWVVRRGVVVGGEDGGHEAGSCGSGNAGGVGGSGGSEEPHCAVGGVACGMQCCDTDTEVCEKDECVPQLPTCSNGDTCGEGKVCQANGVCSEGCLIGGVHWKHGQQNGSNKCEVCDAETTTSWTRRSIGGECGEGSVCNAVSSCLSGCYINERMYSRNEVNPSNGCQACTSANTEAWTPKSTGLPCAGGLCDEGGQCINPMPISAGLEYTCGVAPGGAAKCWGSNETGPLGEGSLIDARLVPTQVYNLEKDVVAVAAGLYHTCAVLSDGSDR